MLAKSLSEPWFSLASCGKKTTEIRVDNEDFHELKLFDIIEFFNDDLGFNIRRKFCVRVTSIERFDTFELLLAKHLHYGLPTVKSIGFGCKILKQIYSTDNEFDKHQKLAIQFERVSAVSNEPIESCP